MDEKYWETDRIIDEKVNRVLISVDSREDQSNIDTADLSTDQED